MRNTDQSKNNYFSILMANFNNARFIKTAINSVISQTYPYWELIIVDDCSTDNSLTIINHLLKDDRIKLIRHERNQGYGGSLKTAAANGLNDIIGIVDADDKLHKDALKIIADAYQKNPDYGFIYSTMWECDAQLKNCIKNRWIGYDVPKKTNIFKIKISHFKTFLRRAYLKTSGFDPDQKRAVDKDIIFKLEEVTKFKFVNIPLYYYRWHREGISQAKSSFQPEFYHYLAKLKAYKRRLNTKIPNFTRKQISFEYYRITFYKVIHFLLYLYDKLKIRALVKGSLEKNYYILESIKLKLRFLKKFN